MHRLQPARQSDVEAINQVVNWAYRGKDPNGEDARAWTTERHIIEGIRTTELDVAEIVRNCDRRGPREEILLLALGTRDEVLGTIHVDKIERGVAEFGLFSVDPDFQSAGIGSNLLKTAEKHAYWKMNARAAIMHVISIRAELLDWYERRGYLIIEDERAPFPPPEVNVGNPRQPGLEFVKLEKRLDWDAGC